MKLITLLFTIVSLNVFAGYNCATELIDDYSLNERTEYIANSGEELTLDRQIIWRDYFSHELSQFCVGEMDVVTYKGTSGKKYVSMTTNTDECDGGNVYGLILDSNNEIVVEVSDGELYCPGLYSYGK